MAFSASKIPIIFSLGISSCRQRLFVFVYVRVVFRNIELFKDNVDPPLSEFDNDDVEQVRVSIPVGDSVVFIEKLVFVGFD